MSSYEMNAKQQNLYFAAGQFIFYWPPTYINRDFGMVLVTNCDFELSKLGKKNFIWLLITTLCALL